MTDKLWNYNKPVPPNGDARKIVTLSQNGMVWIGIRAFNHNTRGWVNNNEPEIARVIAWRDLPQPARGRWEHGRLFPMDDCADLVADSRGLPMNVPTLPEGNPEDD